jgi:hypothetical protein
LPPAATEIVAPWASLAADANAIIDAHTSIATRRGASKRKVLLLSFVDEGGKPQRTFRRQG